ncbi:MULTISPECIES: heavy-metal-associated domain-containing protein [Microbacterium]|uniref:Heavy-metal-associated domain-containing protein n=1 Tax=Microbacterium limosum TaxID=3079935 RepID=A0AAU0MGY8_9MICO|nr:heavy-metal-associated domain-containing protein [Microbacterium sp. Y20]WOQ69860.1 heavy-metal-associated domain-containing protein [Microbacterium sp. Y20]
MSGLESRDLGLTQSGGGCACCSGHASVKEEAASTSRTEVVAEYLVEGMTCGHCVSSVTEELSEISGVGAVDVELHAGGLSKVTVGSAAPLDADAVRQAVEDAGYRLAPVS